MDFNDFLNWERTSRDTLDVKRVYIDIAGDLVAGIVLSEIVYWHLPAKDGRSRLRVMHEGKQWIAARRYEWWERVRITPSQADRAIKILVERGLIEKDVFKFDGTPTTHVRLIEPIFISALADLVLSPSVNPYQPEAIPISATTEIEIGYSRSPLTETTTESTPKTTAESTNTPPTPRGVEDDDEPHTENRDTVKDFDIIREYERLTGRLVSSLILKEDLEDYEREYPPEWIREAFKASADKKNPWPYAKAILDKWHREGKPVATNERKPDQQAPQDPKRYIIPEGYDGARAETRTALDMAWSDTLEQVRRMFDRHIAEAISGRITAQRLEGKTLILSGDLDYYRYIAKTLNGAAGAAGYTLEWGK